MSTRHAENSLLRSGIQSRDHKPHPKLLEMSVTEPGQNLSKDWKKGSPISITMLITTQRDLFTMLCMCPCYLSSLPCCKS